MWRWWRSLTRLMAVIRCRRNRHLRATIRVLAVLVVVDLAALILIGTVILIAWAGMQWLMGW